MPALNTVVHRLSVLSKAHQLRDVPNPTRDSAVQELVRRIRRAYAARGVRPASKAALTRDPLEAILATCTDGLLGIRDRALLLFAFSSGGRRRSEVAGATMENGEHFTVGPGDKYNNQSWADILSETLDRRQLDGHAIEIACRGLQLHVANYRRALIEC